MQLAVWCLCTLAYLADASLTSEELVGLVSLKLNTSLNMIRSISRADSESIAGVEPALVGSRLMLDRIHSRTPSLGYDDLIDLRDVCTTASVVMRLAKPEIDLVHSDGISAIIADWCTLLGEARRIVFETNPPRNHLPQLLLRDIQRLLKRARRVQWKAITVLQRPVRGIARTKREQALGMFEILADYFENWSNERIEFFTDRMLRITRANVLGELIRLGQIATSFGLHDIEKECKSIINKLLLMESNAVIGQSDDNTAPTSNPQYDQYGGPHSRPPRLDQGFGTPTIIPQHEFTSTTQPRLKGTRSH